MHLGCGAGARSGKSAGLVERVHELEAPFPQMLSVDDLQLELNGLVYRQAVSIFVRPVNGVEPSRDSCDICINRRLLGPSFRFVPDKSESGHCVNIIPCCGGSLCSRRKRPAQPVRAGSHSQECSFEGRPKETPVVLLVCHRKMHTAANAG